jgi:hypothetical protein
MHALFRPAASAAILLCFGIATATAQSTTPATDGNAAPASQAAPAATATPTESVQKDAIRVPALGVQPGSQAAPATDAPQTKAAATKQIKTASAKPKKRARAARYVYPADEDEVVLVRPYYAPRYYYAPRPYYRFGHGIGPGFVYGW